MKPAYLASVLLAAAFATGSCFAQSHGVPASVTSFGFGGNFSPAPGVPASVTSVGPRGYGFPCCGPRYFSLGSHRGGRPFGGDGESGRHRRDRGYSEYVPIYAYGGYGYYGDYAPVDLAEQDGSANADSGDGQDAGGPPAMDRPGMDRPGMDRHSRRPVEDAYDRGYEEGRAAAQEGHGLRSDRPHRPSETADKGDSKNDAKSDDEPAPAIEVKTVLIYKDGHKEEVANYAIVGDQLFDFSNGRRKVPVADLDVTATVKANDARGVDFQLPAVRAKK